MREQGLGAVAALRLEVGVEERHGTAEDGGAAEPGVERRALAVEGVDHEQAAAGVEHRDQHGDTADVGEGEVDRQAVLGPEPPGRDHPGGAAHQLASV